jgi:hypothetical protein
MGGFESVGCSGESGTFIAVSMELVCSEETLEAEVAVDLRLPVLRSEDRL